MTTSATSPLLPASGVKENSHFISSKTHLNRSNITAFVNVPTPPSEHHNMHVC
jgi:hypothetical protein